MKRGPQPGRGRAAPASPRDRAIAAWGATLPAEIDALVCACEAETATAAAAKLGYSNSMVSNLLANKYPGDVRLIFEKIRGAFMGEVHLCPVLGEIASDRCIVEQKRPFAANNSTRARLYHACRACSFNLKNDGGAA